MPSRVAGLLVVRMRRRRYRVSHDHRVHVHAGLGSRRDSSDPRVGCGSAVQKTTYYWRTKSGNLLSREYFSEIKEHLSPGGIFFANTTGSFDVLATAQAVFGYTYRYTNFVYAADHPLTPAKRHTCKSTTRSPELSTAVRT